MESPGAKEARLRREERHKQELAAERARAERYRSVSIIVMLVALLVFGYSAYREYRSQNPGWRSDQPPTRQKLEVVTYGWYHASRGWCSYDTGEQITVTQWR